MNVIQPRMLSVFDFDGTLTRHDSFIPFLRFAFGNRAFSRRIVSMALPTLRCMGKQMTRDELDVYKRQPLYRSFTPFLV